MRTLRKCWAWVLGLVALWRASAAEEARGGGFGAEEEVSHYADPAPRESLDEQAKRCLPHGDDI